MSFGGTILENYHSQEEPLSSVIERLSERGEGGDDFLYYGVLSVWKRKNGSGVKEKINPWERSELR